MARRADHTHDEIRDMAVQAARRMIKSDGLEKMKLRGIAREIGYAPGTLYNVFDSMDALMMQVNAQTIDELVRDLSTAESVAGPARLPTLLATYGTFANKNTNLWKAVFDYSMDDPEGVPDWYVAKINEGLLIVERAVVELGGTNPRHNPSDVARILWAGLHGIFSLGAEGNLRMVSTTGPEDLAALFVSMIQNAVAE